LRAQGRTVIASIGRGLRRAAKETAAVTVSAARHAVWYVRYQVDGTVRSQRERPRPGRSSD